MSSPENQSPDQAATPKENPVSSEVTVGSSESSTGTNDPTHGIGSDAKLEREPKPAHVAPRPKPISIGSQRDVADTKLAPAQPAMVERAKRERFEPDPSKLQVESEPAPPPVILHREGLGEDVENEIERALSGISMDEVVEKVSHQPVEPEEGERLKATITRIDAQNVLVSLKGRFEGILSLLQFKKPPVVGDLVEVVVRAQNEEDGLYDVGLPGAAADAGDWETIKKNDVVEARVTGSNTGGLEVAVGNLRGFVPASQIERFRVEQFGDYTNKKFNCLVTEVNPGRKKLVVSRRAILDREYEETRRELMKSLEPGVEIEGIVTRLADFGAFVDIGGVEGLIHISKLSWSRLQHPKEVVQVGQKVKVKVEKLEPDTGRISLSHRDTLVHPWENAATRFPNGSLVKGTVSRIAQFGAFVKLDNGVEGLIHISELAHHRVFAVKNIVKEGDDVEVKVLSVDADAQKISLSLKATIAAPEKPVDKDKVEEDLAPRDLAVKSTGEPLQGGTKRKSGGEQFGLRL